MLLHTEPWVAAGAALAAASALPGSPPPGGRHVLFGPDAHDEEIYLSGPSALWSAGGSLRRQIDCDSAVAAAVWCTFPTGPGGGDAPGDAEQPWLALLLHNGTLELHAATGECHAASLAKGSPRPLPSLHACRLGLLLSRPSHGATPEVSLLRHPLEEALEIGANAGRENAGLENAGLEVMLWAGDAPRGGVTLLSHRRPGGHRLWALSVPTGDSDPPTLVPLWREATAWAAPSPADVVLGASSGPGDGLCLCLLHCAAGGLWALPLATPVGMAQGGALTAPIFSLGARAAAAVPGGAMWDSGEGAAPPLLLILDSGGGLSLHCGPVRLVTFALSLPEGSPPVVGLCDTVGPRVSLVMGGGKTCRASLAHATPSSPLVMACLSMLGGCLPGGAALRCGLLQSMLASLPRGCGDPSEEWGAFVAAMLGGRGDGGGGQGKPWWVLGTGECPWDALLRSPFYADLAAAHLTAVSLAAPVVTLGEGGVGGARVGGVAGAVALPPDKRPAALDCLHALYDDCALTAGRGGWMRPLGGMLAGLAVASGRQLHADRYARDGAVTLSMTSSSVTSSPMTSSPPPADAHALLRAIAAGSPAAALRPFLSPLLHPGSPPYARRALANTRRLVLAYACRFSHTDAWALVTGRPPRAPLSPSSLPPLMAALGFTPETLAAVPPAVALPLTEVLWAARGAPQPGWPPIAYRLVGRPELAAAAAGVAPAVGEGEAAPESGGADDGLDVFGTALCRALFPRDGRCGEARRMLQSCRPVPLRVTLAGGGAAAAAAAEATNPELVAQRQARLWALAQRTCALGVGRGAAAMGAAVAAHGPWAASAAAASPVIVPPLVLSGRLPQQHDAVLGLDLAVAAPPTDWLTWPHFHGGVAAALRLSGTSPPPGAPCAGDPLGRSWIASHRPPAPTAAHGGLLFGLGLTGHLRALSTTDAYRYLRQEHDPTSLGLLLGLGAAHAGTGDAAAARVLFLHLPGRQGPAYPELELPSAVQTAALMGVGLLYRGTSHRHVTELLLAEIGRRPPSGEGVAEREAHAMAAGLALGLVNLGQGRAAAGLADLGLESRLRHYTAPGATDEPLGGVGGAHGAAAGGYGPLAPPSPPHGLFAAAGTPAGGAVPVGGPAPAGPSAGSGLLMDGGLVNLAVTSPAATLALGLLFLRTGDGGVAAQLAPPETPFALEQTRPDFLLGRAVARSLVQWDDVAPTAAWMASQLPPLLAGALQLTPADGVGLDREALVLGHVHSVAGTCLGLGLRFAGTGCAAAAELLRTQALAFLGLKRAAASGALAADAATLESCAVAAALALAVVMSGTGHLHTLRLLRHLRGRVQGTAVGYGSHMALGLAIGLLFLGGGALALGREPHATAALVVALVPRFPSTTGDSRCHLQALRHLYALAASPRLMDCLDFTTRLRAPAPLAFYATDGARLPGRHTAPCLLPAGAEAVAVLGPRYWPQAAGPIAPGGRLLVLRRDGSSPARDGSTSALAPALALAVASSLRPVPGGPPLAIAAAGLALAADYCAAHPAVPVIVPGDNGDDDVMDEGAADDDVEGATAAPAADSDESVIGRPLVASLRRRLESTFVARGVAAPAVLRQYLLSGNIPSAPPGSESVILGQDGGSFGAVPMDTDTAADGGGGGGGFAAAVGAYLTVHGVPAAAIIAPALARARAAVGPGSGDRSLPVLAASLPGCPPYALLLIARSGAI